MKITREIRLLTWLCIVGLAVGLLAVVSYARAIVMPLVMAALVAILLKPVHRALRRFHIPSQLSAALVILACMLLCGTLAVLVATPAADWMERLPSTLRNLEEQLRVVRAPLEELSDAGDRVREATEITKQGDLDAPLEVEITPPRIADSFLSMTGQALGTLAVMVCVVYFILSSDDRFLRKSVELARRIENKKRVVQVLRTIEGDVSRYLLSITLINVCLGVVIGTGLWLLGLPNPVLWGVMAATLNYLPYIGAIAGTCVIGLVSFAEAGVTGSALIAPLFYAGCSAVEGQVVTPLVLGVRLNLDPLLVFISLLVWGWLWGVPGAILAVPILATLKILCDRVERFHAIAHFMSR